MADSPQTGSRSSDSVISDGTDSNLNTPTNSSPKSGTFRREIEMEESDVDDSSFHNDFTKADDFETDLAKDLAARTKQTFKKMVSFSGSELGTTELSETETDRESNYTSGKHFVEDNDIYNHDFGSRTNGDYVRAKSIGRVQNG